MKSNKIFEIISNPTEKHFILNDLFLQICIRVLFCSYYACAKEIAIIGAGTSGLFTAKMLLDKKYKFTVFDQAPQVGGLWFDSDKRGAGIPSAVYDGLM